MRPLHPIKKTISGLPQAEMVFLMEGKPGAGIARSDIGSKSALHELSLRRKKYASADMDGEPAVHFACPQI